MTPKNAIVLKEWIEDGQSGVYPIESIESVTAQRDIPWGTVVVFVLIGLGTAYFGWFWVGLGFAVAAIIWWKFFRLGFLFLHLPGNSVLIQSAYQRVPRQKEAIDSLRN